MTQTPPLTPDPLELEKWVSRWILRLRKDSPFFATLAMFTRFYPSSQIPTAATDGLSIFYNPQFMGSLTPDEQQGVVVHEVLHAALLHVPRRAERDARLWNVAADIVVNAQVLEAGFKLPRGHLRNEALEHLTVEEVYEKLLEEGHPQNFSPDLLEAPPDDAPAEAQRPSLSGALREEWRRKLEGLWKDALEKALVVQRMSGQGQGSAGLERLIGGVLAPQLDWKSQLWRYLVRTPSDFQGFDRRFLGRGLYLEALEGESVKVWVCVDTSGSVGDSEMRLFLSEVQGILGAYPMLECRLYYADAELYGPYTLSSSSEFPVARGGGGTDFRPFFAALEADHREHGAGVCVYLTDGYGTFPVRVPELPTLWVVQPGGLRSSEFPFGEVVTLLQSG